ncbi:MAG: DUF1461 domain-containing protein [Coriobacteriia bacterium]|nr:DUF1461 domain-containing protein [Coriobacteriia bacterium]
MRRVQAGVVGALIAFAVLGLTILPLFTPAFTRVLSSQYSLAAQAGLSRDRISAVAEQVRDFVVNDEATTLPATVDGRSGFDADAVSHLLDVRRVLVGARWATAVPAVLAMIWIAVRWSRRDRTAIASAMSVAAITGVGCIVLGALAGLVDFDAFFRAFHGVFFSAGNWEFPADSLLIQTFPEPFWATGAAVWGGLVVVCSAALAWGARVLRRRGDSAEESARNDGA